MAKAGYNIVLNGFGDPTIIERLRSSLEVEFGVRVIYSSADMRVPEQIREMAAIALNEFGCVDVLVNNSGIQHVEAIETFPAVKWDEIIAINLSASFHSIQNLLPAMKVKGRGRIINIASAHALVASPFKSAYVAAKHGLLGLTKTVALEVAETGITCNAICPGYVYTPLVEGQIDATASARGIDRESVIRDVLLAAQPTKQFVQCEDLAALVLFLAGDHANAINGAALSIDGWLDRKMTESKQNNAEARDRKSTRNSTGKKPKTINLALQGGGAHGAFSWGVLDKLLEDGRIQFEAVSGTSAGAMNAVVLADGLAADGNDGACEALHKFWEAVNHAARFSPMQRSSLDMLTGNWNLDYSPGFVFFDLLSRIVSPYQLNPLNINLLRELLVQQVDFEWVRNF